MHSHVLPMPPCTWIAVSHTVRALRAAYALATAAAARASAGSSASTAQAAYNIALEGAFAERLGLGEQVLHGLERTDRHAVLATLPGILGGQLDRALHHADEVGGGEGDGERLPRHEIVGRQRAEPGRGVRRRVDEPAHRPGQIDAAGFVRCGDRHLDQGVAGSAEGERDGAAGGIDGDAGPAGEPAEIGGDGDGTRRRRRLVLHRPAAAGRARAAVR